MCLLAVGACNEDSPDSGDGREAPIEESAAADDSQSLVDARSSLRPWRNLFLHEAARAELDQGGLFIDLGTPTSTNTPGVDGEPAGCSPPAIGRRVSRPLQVWGRRWSGSMRICADRSLACDCARAHHRANRQSKSRAPTLYWEPLSYLAGGPRSTSRSIRSCRPLVRSAFISPPGHGGSRSTGSICSTSKAVRSPRRPTGRRIQEAKRSEAQKRLEYPLGRTDTIGLGNRPRRTLVATVDRSYSFYLHIPPQARLIFEYGADVTMTFTVRVHVRISATSDVSDARHNANCFLFQQAASSPARDAWHRCWGVNPAPASLTRPLLTLAATRWGSTQVCPVQMLHRQSHTV